METEHPRAEAFSRNLAGNRDDGDDLYQESLLAAWRQFDKLRDLNSFRPWLYRIIINRQKSRLRLNWFKRRVSLNRNDFENCRSYDLTMEISARRWLERAFRGLTTEERALVSLFELEGWSIAELAEIYDRPQGTIKSQLSRARGKMRAELAAYFPRNETNEKTGELGYALPRSKKSP